MLLTFKKNPWGTGSESALEQVEIDMDALLQAPILEYYGYRSCRGNQYQLSNEQSDLLMDAWKDHMEAVGMPSCLSHTGWLIDLQGTQWILTFHDDHFRINDPKVCEFPYGKPK